MNASQYEGIAIVVFSPEGAGNLKKLLGIFILTP
jgi:hypothetical protein